MSIPYDIGPDCRPDGTPFCNAIPRADPVGDALRADAEEARQKLREAGLTCPSCGKNAGDTFGRHCLVMITRTPIARDRAYGHDVALLGKPERSCECRDGRPVVLDGADFETWKNAANIALMDDFWFRQEMAFRAPGFPT